MNIKVDLSKEGLDMCFRNYERVMLYYLWKRTDAPASGSGELWRHANKVLGPKENGRQAISRASVIFAANRFVDLGLWSFKDATGKGGHHRRYFADMTQEEFWKQLLATAQQKLVF